VLINAAAMENQADMIIVTNIYTGASACIVKEAQGMKIAAMAMVLVRAASRAGMIHMVAHRDSRCIEQQLTTQLEHVHIWRGWQCVCSLVITA